MNESSIQKSKIFKIVKRSILNIRNDYYSNDVCTHIAGVFKMLSRINL